MLRSWFYFQKAKGRPPFVECADPDEYISLGHFEGRNIFGTNVWDYYAELWDARADPSVLVLCYEALQGDLSRYLPSIAAFLGVGLDGVKAEEVLRLSSTEYMTEHASQFDENFIARRGAELGRAKKVMEPAPKVTQGHQPLQPRTLEWVEAQLREHVAVRTGLESYADMAAFFAKGAFTRVEL